MQTIELKISGMVCQACQNHVMNALKEAAGVQDAQVDLAAQCATVRGENLNGAALVRAVEDEGYGAQIQ